MKNAIVLVLFKVFILAVFAFAAGCGPKTVTTASTLNFHSADYNREWENIKEKLDLDGNVRLEHFVLKFCEDGRFGRFDFDILQKEEDHILLHRFVLDAGSQVFRVTTSKHDKWPQFYHLVDADTFFKVLAGIEFGELTAESQHGHYIRSTGWVDSYADASNPNCLVTDSGLIELPESSLPITCFHIFNSWERRRYLYQI